MTRWVMTLALAAAACSGTLDDDDDDGLPGGADADPNTPDADPAVQPDASPDYLMLTGEEQALFDTINAERVERGLGTVALRADLNCAAKRHSNDVGTTQTCSHTGSDGSDPGTRVADCGGAGWTGEILACGQTTPQQAVDGWIGSPGHNAIMFTPGQRFIGVGMHNNFWTAIFDQ